MSNYDNANKGVLFKNDRKEKDTHPDYKGSITITQPGEYWLSSWVKEGQKGKFMSLSATLKEQQAPAPDKAGQWKAAAPKAPQRTTYGDASDKSEGSAYDGMDSDIPF